MSWQSGSVSAPSYGSGGSSSNGDEVSSSVTGVQPESAPISLATEFREEAVASCELAALSTSINFPRGWRSSGYSNPGPYVVQASPSVIAPGGVQPRTAQVGWQNPHWTGADGVRDLRTGFGGNMGVESISHVPWGDKWGSGQPSVWGEHSQASGFARQGAVNSSEATMRGSSGQELAYGPSGWQSVRTPELKVPKEPQELTGFEKARFSLENGRDFEFGGKEDVSCSGPSDSFVAPQDWASLRIDSQEDEQQQFSNQWCHTRIDVDNAENISCAASAQNEVRPPAERSFSANSASQMRRSRNHQHRRNDSNVGTSRVSTSLEGGQHTGSVFHPLPSLFSYPPQTLEPWLPTAGVKKDLPTVAVLNSCRRESRMVSEYSDSHQAMSLMLALPGLPISTAPMLTLQEAGNILRVINEPLAVLKVGRLTKSVSPNPNVLRATDDVGILALWLLPTSEVKVIWHSLKVPAPNGQTSPGWEKQDVSDLCASGDGAPFKELFCFIEASEELACIPPRGQEPADKGNGVQLNTLDQDPSGRSFRLTRRSSHVRQMRDLTAKLDAEKLKTGGRVSRETAKLQALLRACTSEPDQEENLFFWVAEPSLAKGRQILEEMQTQVDDLPTFSRKTGVPQEKLQKVYECFVEAEQIADASKVDDETRSQPSNSFSSWFGFGPGLAAPSHLFAMGSPTNLFEQMVKSTTRSRGTSRGSMSSCASRSASPSSSDSRSNDVSVSDSCVLSATANFVVSDRRWNLNHLSTVTMTVAVGVVSTGEVVDKETSEKAARECAHELAKRKAECGAQAEAERLGRRRLEELAAQKAAKLPRRGSVTTPASETGDVQSLTAFSQHSMRFGEDDANPVSPARPVPSTAISPAGVRPGDALNHWQHHSGQRSAQREVLLDNMYIPFGDPKIHPDMSGSDGFGDPEATLGLGFGSGPNARRNGRPPHFGQARPPGSYYEQWHMSHNQFKQQVATDPAMPYGSHNPNRPLWTIPTSPWGPSFGASGIQNGSRASAIPQAGQGPRLYPRHLPPMLPYFNLVHQGLLHQGHQSFWDARGQSRATSVSTSGGSAVEPDISSPMHERMPGVRKRFGDVRRNLKEIRSKSQNDKDNVMLGELYNKRLDQFRRRSMGEACLNKIQEVRRKSLGDLGRKRLGPYHRRSVDWEVGERGNQDCGSGWA